jgi:1-acyl-sn-glycerol-3-phosphate acyltransferase
MPDTSLEKTTDAAREGKTFLPIQIARAIRLGLHFFWGAATVAVVYPFVRDSRRLWLKQRWSRQLLDILGIELDATLAGIAPGSLIVANHISWLDIFALNAARPVAFISKAEVRQWPLIGWLSAKTDTVFLMRGSRGHARIVNGQIDALLNAGKDVALFPEGTTTDGTHLLHFHGALLQPAVETGRPVQPVALCYQHPDGRRCEAAAYAGETTMGECLLAILATPQMRVRLRPEQALDSAQLDRRSLALEARKAIAFSLGLPLASTAPGTPACLPAGWRSDVCPTDSPSPAPADSA